MVLLKTPLAMATTGEKSFSGYELGGGMGRKMDYSFAIFLNLGSEGIGTDDGHYTHHELTAGDASLALSMKNGNRMANTQPL